MRIKYPRTYHLPFSLGTTNDDRVLDNMDSFIGKQVVVTEKLDGENTTMYCDYIHARSIDSKNHLSRNWVKNLHASIKYDIPEGYRICGENLYAKHSIFYDKLESYFYVFSIWDENNICLSWDDTISFCNLLGLKTVPVLYIGLYNQDAIVNCFTGKSRFGDEQEGYVVRIKDSFPYNKFGECVAKFVRANHIQTNEHWIKSIITKNELA